MNTRNFQANASPIPVSDQFLEVTNKNMDLLGRNKYFILEESESLLNPNSGAHCPSFTHRRNSQGFSFGFVVLAPSTPEPRRDWDEAQNEGTTHFSCSHSSCCTSLTPQRSSRSWHGSKNMKRDWRQHALPPSLLVLTTVHPQQHLLKSARQISILFPCPTRASPHGLKPQSAQRTILFGSCKSHMAQRSNHVALFDRCANNHRGPFKASLQKARLSLLWRHNPK